MWDLPGPRLEPVSPALTGGFLTTAPPGKSYNEILHQDLPFGPAFLLSAWDMVNLPRKVSDQRKLLFQSWYRLFKDILLCSLNIKDILRSSPCVIRLNDTKGKHIMIQVIETTPVSCHLWLKKSMKSLSFSDLEKEHILTMHLTGIWLKTRLINIVLPKQ